MYVLCLFVLMIILVLFRVLYDSKRVHITHDMVDDALTTALISACVYNTDELALSGATVIYDTVTPVREPSYIISSITGQPILDTTPYDTINDGKLFSPGADAYLNGAYQKFVRNLKQNLKLDDAMNSTISGISGQVAITDFSVYNKFYNMDEDGNHTDFRIVKYTYSPGGWSAYPYGINSTASCYNSLDHSNYTVVETSVSACIAFDVVTGKHSDWAAPGLTEDDYRASVSYQRVVDITTY